MYYNTVYVGMDVHKNSFTLCAYTIESEKASYFERTEADYKKVLKYLEFLRTIYGNNTNFLCGYEAGCLGYTLYHQLSAQNVDCVILAPTTMLEQRSRKRIKTDRRDAEIIAKCLAQHNYSPVHIPSATDEETKEFLRMRDDHKLALKKVKQQILAFCLRHGYRYDGNSHWTAAHMKWLKALNPEALYKEILEEYLLTYIILLHRKFDLYKILTDFGIGEQNDLQTLKAYQKQLNSYQTDYAYERITEVPQYHRLYKKMEEKMELAELFADVMEPVSELSSLRMEKAEEDRGKQERKMEWALAILSILTVFSALIDCVDYLEVVAGNWPIWFHFTWKEQTLPRIQLVFSIGIVLIAAWALVGIFWRKRQKH